MDISPTTLAAIIRDAAAGEIHRKHFLNPRQFQLVLLNDADCQLLDLRIEKEYETNRIQGAGWFPFEEFSQRYTELDKKRRILLYCSSGGRAVRAAKMLMDKGFKDFYLLEGGLFDWQEQGLAVDIS